MPRIKREEAKLLAYTVLFNKQGQLITERISTDIKKLKKFLSKEEFNLLQSVLRSASTELDAVHNKIEADLNARITYLTSLSYCNIRTATSVGSNLIYFPFLFYRYIIRS